MKLLKTHLLNNDVFLNKFNILPGTINIHHHHRHSDYHNHRHHHRHSDYHKHYHHHHQEQDCRHRNCHQSHPIFIYDMNMKWLLLQVQLHNKRASHHFVKDLINCFIIQSQDVTTFVQFIIQSRDGAEKIITLQGPHLHSFTKFEMSPNVNEIAQQYQVSYLPLSAFLGVYHHHLRHDVNGKVNYTYLCEDLDVWNIMSCRYCSSECLIYIINVLYNV